MRGKSNSQNFYSRIFIFAPSFESSLFLHFSSIFTTSTLQVIYPLSI